jgi:hypothetical protein
MDFKKSVIREAEIIFKQQKAIEFLKEVAAKALAESLTAATTTVSIETVTTATVSQQSASSAGTVVAAETSMVRTNSFTQCVVYNNALLKTSASIVRRA